MTLEAIRLAKASADLHLQQSYRALVSLLVANEPALSLLSGLAATALEKHVLDQMELEVIANGALSAEEPLPKSSPSSSACACGICDECRDAIGY